MPAYFINPLDDEHIDLLNKLDEQNQDLRVFISDKNSHDFTNKVPGKKAIGDITDDSHISTASEGAYCGIFFEGNNIKLRDIFLNAIKNSNLQRILWISKEEPINNILKIENLTYIKYSDKHNYFDTVLNLEEIEEVDEKFIDIQ
tara:strand:- start:8309 stop:8743 length:435 start_codon:yes stop_codon:yes gene_type:complete